ncbi:MAG: type II secretion system F family protein [Caldilineales bacterium]|nr:type II secretion system F family protein [Caldilineales bacterium]
MNWLNSLLHPGQTMEALLALEPDRYAFRLAALAGMAEALLLIFASGLRGFDSLFSIFPPLTIGMAFGIGYLILGGHVLCWSIRHAGGIMSTDEGRGVLARASLPLLVMAALICPVVIAIILTQPDIGRVQYAVVGVVVGFVFHGWALAVLFINLRVASQLSPLRVALGLGLALLAVSIALMVCAIGVLALTLIRPRLAGQLTTPLLAAVIVGALGFTLVMAFRGNRPMSSPLLAGNLGHGIDAHVAVDDELEMRASLYTRVIYPAWGLIRRLAKQSTPQSSIESLHQDLTLAGFPYGMSVIDFLGLRILIALVVGTLGFTLLLMYMPTQKAIMLGILVLAFGFYLPTYWLKKRINQRKKEMQRALPEVFDMLSICVSAGLGFDAALLRVAYRWDNALTFELRQVVTETRVGVPRVTALRRLVKRTDVEDLATFVAVIAQAERLGVSIGRVLKIQSEQLRIRRRQHAEEEAQKAPAKMLLPMALFILPATLAIILGPAVPRLARMFTGL